MSTEDRVMSDRIRVVAVGYYGAPNIGDELLLAALAAQVQARGGELVALSNNPAYTREAFGIEAVDYFNLGEVGRALAGADLLVFGGGGIFQDHHPFHLEALYDPTQNDIAAYARVFYMARQFGVRTAIWGHGVGPLNQPQAQEVVKDVFEHADDVTLRDADSLALLRSLGVTREIAIGPDPGWGYVADAASREPAAFEAPGIEALAGRKKLAIIARLWEFSHDWEEKLLTALRETLTPEWSVVWVGFQWSESAREQTSDRAFLETMQSQLGDAIPGIVVDRLTPDEALTLLRQCDAAFSMRLHASIMTIASEIPTAALEYDRKMTLAHDMAGMPADLRLQLTDNNARFSHALHRLTGGDAPAWTIAPERLTELAASSGVHDAMLDAAMARAREAARPKDSWQNRDFDWLSTWLEQTIWQKNAAQRMREKALELLRFRDGQLAMSEAQAASAKAAEQAALAQSAEHEKRVQELSEMFNALQRAGAAPGVQNAEEAQEADAGLATLRRELEASRQKNEALYESLTFAQDELAAAQAELAQMRKSLENHRNHENREIRENQTRHEPTLGMTPAATAAPDASNVEPAGTATVSVPSSSLGPNMLVRKFFSAPRTYTERALYILRNGGLRALASAAKRHTRSRQALQNGQVREILDASRHGLSPTDPDLWFQASAQLQRSELVIVSQHRYDWAGGTHRHAQLALAALHAGHRVIYLYVSPQDKASVAPRSDALQIPGLIHHSIDAVTLEYVFERVSEAARLVIGVPDARVSPFFLFAKHRGVETVFDVAYDWTHAAEPHRAMLSTLLAQADRCTVATPALADAVRQQRDAVEVLPGAALHTVFDPYKTYDAPAGFVPKNGRVALCFCVNGLEAIDWSLVRRSAEQAPELTFCFIGTGAAAPGMPANVVVRAAEPLAALPAYVAHAHFLFFPLLRNALVDGDATAGLYAGLHLRKPVVTSLDFGITPSADLHVCEDEASFVARCAELGRAEPSARPDDAFVARNSWLGRLEHLCPPVPRHDVSVVILIHNNAKIIARALETLLAHCSPYLADVVVVDNASVDGGAEIVEQQFPQVKLVRNPENGCSSGRNLGVEHSTGRYIAFFDSDQWFAGSSGFAEALRVLETDASVGVIGWNAGWFDKTRTDLGGMIADYCPNRAMNAVAIRDGYRADIGFLGTSGFFMRRRTFDATHGFDTFYDPTCFEDTDLCFQIKALDMKVTFRDLSGIRHQPHQTTQANSGSDKYTALFLRNAQYFKEKWRDYPQFYVDYTW
ncbi:polysaccharide pyruvyl transferase family protein [Caballeronia sp. LZ043]|uniref:polysaccharide pyruvyl transferase family protein n=1 Tax=Caballeronia sp. LZ043 TaxID=3038569 RepID=UPI00285CAEAE|nr:polysaccharide pyruvyl transferase family protein [Caballeronia sp. LZ043]MDR5820807.1 polysaccharide pyruvyl transferase family protein [Caballeronia sp. LZ043]